MPTATTPLSLALGSTGRIVRAVQRAVGVEDDGKLGPVTLAAMRRADHGSTRERWDVQALQGIGVDIRVGVDLSGHNEGGNKGLVNFDKLKSAGISFVWLKLTEGRSYVNAEAERQAKEARRVGISVGGYHFGDPSADRRGQSIASLVEDAQAEAAHYMRTRRRFLGVPELTDMLDVERGYASVGAGLAVGALGGTPAARAQATARWVGEFTRYLDAETRCVTGIYTARWAVDAYLSRSPISERVPLAARPLWLASYNTGASPKRQLPAPWQFDDWRVWQCSGSAAVPGVDGRCDLNIALGEDLAPCAVAG